MVTAPGISSVGGGHRQVAPWAVTVPLLQPAARVWLELSPGLFRGAGVLPREAVDRAAAPGHLPEAAGKSWFFLVRF